MKTWYEQMQLLNHLQHAFGHPLDEEGLALSKWDVGHYLRFQILEVGVDTQVLQTTRILKGI
jgi:hypothetical protein